MNQSGPHCLSTNANRQTHSCRAILRTKLRKLCSEDWDRAKTTFILVYYPAGYTRGRDESRKKLQFYSNYLIFCAFHTSITLRNAAMCLGVVPQQPPNMLTPVANNSGSRAAIISGVWG